MKPRIKVTTLGVGDLEKSLAFYRDGLGLPTRGIIGTEFEDGAVVFFDMSDDLIRLAEVAATAAFLASERPALSPAHSSTQPAGYSPARSADRKELITVHGKDTNDDTQTFDVVITRVLDAPVEEVWKAWSDSEYVRRWWGPTGFTSPSAEMDFRVGGASLVCMRAPAEYGGQDMYNTWTYTRIDPHERIEFVSNFADKDGAHIDRAAIGMPQGVPHDVPHVIIFEAADDTGTKMTVTEHGYTTEQARDLSKAGMEQCLEKMVAMFAG